MVVIHILESLIVKREDSYALNSLAGSLAAAVAVPALFVSPYAMAQSGASRVPELAPVQVEGEASPYQPDSVQSSKMTAPLLLSLIHIWHGLRAVLPGRIRQHDPAVVHGFDHVPGWLGVADRHRAADLDLSLIHICFVVYWGQGCKSHEYVVI